MLSAHKKSPPRRAPRIFAPVAALTLLALAIASPGGQARTRGGAAIVIGRGGGNAMPYAVSIALDGRVSATGMEDHPRMRRHLSTTTVRRLLGLARAEGFESLPSSIPCGRFFPDVGQRFLSIRIDGKVRRVSSAGSCSKPFETLYRAISRAVGLS